MPENIHNPMNGGRSETVFDRLNHLADEISNGIVSLSSAKKEDLLMDIDQLRALAGNESTPEAVFATLLYRKYAGIAMELKESTDGSAANFLPELPPLISTDSAVPMDELSGMIAVKTSTFVLRAISTMFAFISFVVMSTVYHVGYADFNPSSDFTNECKDEYGILNGNFNMRPYQFVLSVGVITYI